MSFDKHRLGHEWTSNGGQVLGIVLTAGLLAGYIVTGVVVRLRCGFIIQGHPVYSGVRQVATPWGGVGKIVFYPFGYIDYKLTGTMWAYQEKGSGKIIGTD